ncbi:MAG TPA: PhzF family phenazine biosynthesis protein, partial [Bacillota bacterium]|nr:PhzF family phenazine biosynthesis protein [Bacillota bacterium]
IFTPETYYPDHHLNVRVFVDVYGIPEDPATGSANGCLAGYLVKHRFFGIDQINLQVEQGYEVGRPALLYLQAQSVDNQVAVRVGGRVQWVARGEWDF